LDGIKSGVNYDDTWAKSLGQIHMITPNIAEGIAAVYPTIRSLYEGHRRCESVYEAMNMLENIRVPVISSNFLFAQWMSAEGEEIKSDA
jgi:hypothetical protein